MKCRSDNDGNRHTKLLLSVVLTRLGMRRNAEQMTNHPIRQLHTGSNILLEQASVRVCKNLSRRTNMVLGSSGNEPAEDVHSG